MNAVDRSIGVDNPRPGQYCMTVQNDKILNDDQAEHSNHTNVENIIENLTNAKDVQVTEPSSFSTEVASASNAVSTIQTKTPTITSSLASPAPQDRWSRDKHIELVIIVGNPGAVMLTRAMAKELSVALAHERLFVYFLCEEEPKKVFEAIKHPRWVDAMQEEMNQFYRNKV
nr:retrovirus-related Pol polyprotein from transposon TNT 1-94 [Tanacetum cinerariifolium]